jgi:purine-nucleoside/S-methyl-5'-thioadenosine phosphorylase / adenosine deaminase
VSTGELSYELPGCGRVLFTTRAEGNVSSVSGEGSQLSEGVRERLRERIGAARIARGRQVHGSVVARVGEGDDQRGASRVEADGQATALRRVGVMVLTADCLPVALGSPSAVAMLHAGWRGLAAGVLEQGVLALRELDGSDEIVAVIGPGAGACCYEVGPEVHTALTRASRRGPIDLRALARRRLLAAGVEEVREVSACTICDRRFFSHRREGERAGRQAGVAWLS